MFFPASALLAMHSIYVGQLLRPAAAPLIICMRVRLGGVAMVCDYPHPAVRPYIIILIYLAGAQEWSYLHKICFAYFLIGLNP